MDETLVLLGVVCLIAAIVGGGLKALGVQVPTLASPLRQVMLALLGASLVCVGGRGAGDRLDENEIAPLNENTSDDIAAESTSAETASDDLTTNTAVAMSATKPIEAPSPEPAIDNQQAEPERSVDVAIGEVAAALERDPPSRIYTANQFARGYLRFTQFTVTGLDLLVTATFDYDRSDGTGWPPASPPVDSVADYFCIKNQQTAKLLKQQVRITVMLTVMRGGNSNSFTFGVICDTSVSRIGPVVL